MSGDVVAVGLSVVGHVKGKRNCSLENRHWYGLVMPSLYVL